MGLVGVVGVTGVVGGGEVMVVMGLMGLCWVDGMGVMVVVVLVARCLVLVVTPLRLVAVVFVFQALFCMSAFWQACLVVNRVFEHTVQARDLFYRIWVMYACVLQATALHQCL